MCITITRYDGNRYLLFNENSYFAVKHFMVSSEYELRSAIRSSFTYEFDKSGKVYPRNTKQSIDYCVPVYISQKEMTYQCKNWKEDVMLGYHASFSNLNKQDPESYYEVMEYTKDFLKKRIDFDDDPELLISLLIKFDFEDIMFYDGDEDIVVETFSIATLEDIDKLLRRYNEDNNQ